MEERSFKVKVNNVSPNAEQFIVARPVGTELWYWGSWKHEDQAKEIAKMIDGIVVERID